MTVLVSTHVSTENIKDVQTPKSTEEANKDVLKALLEPHPATAQDHADRARGLGSGVNTLSAKHAQLNQLVRYGSFGGLIPHLQTQHQ